MKKTEKKEDKKKAEKKKTGKKKSATNKDSLKLASKQLQKEFNKKMKALVKEVRKDTQTTIKTIMKEAREKIHAGSEFIMNDVLKAVVTQYEHLTGEKEEGQRVLGKEAMEESSASKQEKKPVTQRPAATTAVGARPTPVRARTPKTAPAANSKTSTASQARKPVVAATTTDAIPPS